MAEIKRAKLFGQLNRFSYQAMEQATVFCKMRGNPYVELVHWVYQVLQSTGSDLHLIIQRYGLDDARLAKDLVATLDRLPRGATAISDFSPHLEHAIERGWLYSSLLFGDTVVRSGHLIVGMLKTSGLREVFQALSREFTRINVDDLTDSFANVVAGSVENETADGPGPVDNGVAPGEFSSAMPPATMGKQEALARFSIDLTEKARKGEIDPIVGRDEEIRQVIDILMRRRQNNPILTGEAGVGKTAVVEGFALRIAGGDVPPALRDVIVRTLDLGLLQAGASMKGEFENRLRQVIEEVQSSPSPVILFIDEAHTLIGAGGAPGQGDAANLLKPALARGTLRTIAATTWSEYKQYFEKDPALTRRFQLIKIEEPSEQKAVQMIRGLANVLEKHHRVRIKDEALIAAVKLSKRYIPSRQLPDKAVSLIDTTCARVAISHHATPPAIEDCQRQVEALEIEREILERETAIGVDHVNRGKELNEKLAAEKSRLKLLQASYERELEKVRQLLALREKVATSAVGDADDKPGSPLESGAALLAVNNDAPLLAQLEQLKEELAAIQGEAPLVLPDVDEQAVASVVADWTGIPVGRMVKNEIQAVLDLADTLEKRVIGQRHGLDAIARRILTARGQLVDPGKPVGVFLLSGPSGVGKTETAHALAEALYGGDSGLITVNMSEFQEEHTVSTLKGAPPGYEGFGKGGVLTEAVRRRPYSIILLDEIEKAHSSVHEIFFQVFDKGRMDDGEGRTIDFKNTIILLTSNVGSELIMAQCANPDEMPSAAVLANELDEPLRKIFPAALLGRLVVVPYLPLNADMLHAIIKLQLSRVQKRLRESHGANLTYDEEVTKLIASRCTKLESGGRMVDAILTQTVLPEISREILSQMLDGGRVVSVAIKVKSGDFAYEFESSNEATA